MTPEENRLVRQSLAHNRKVGGWGQRGRRYSLSGLIRCSSCGGGCVIGNSSSTKKKYYYCNTRRSGRLCDNRKWVPMERIQEYVHVALSKRWEEIVREVERPSVEEESPEIAKLRVELEDLQRMYQDSMRPSVLVAIEDIKSEILTLQQLTDTRKGDQAHRLDHLERIADPRVWDFIEEKDRGGVYRDLVDHVVIGPDGIEDIRLLI